MEKTEVLWDCRTTIDVRRFEGPVVVDTPETIDNSEGMFGIIQPPFGNVFTPFQSRERNMNSMQHTGGQAAI